MKATHQPPTGVPVTPAVILRGAAVYLQQHGWTRGAFFDPDDDGPFPAACATGAIRMAIHGDLTQTFSALPDDSEQRKLIGKAQRHLAAHLHDGFDPEETSSIDVIGDWNDDEQRTLADVVDALNDAANAWDRGHPMIGQRP
jgi:hypothetical protein